MIESWTSPKLATHCRFCAMTCRVIVVGPAPTVSLPDSTTPNNLPLFPNRGAALSLHALVLSVTFLWESERRRKIAKCIETRRLRECEVQGYLRKGLRCVDIWIWLRSFKEENYYQKEHKIIFKNVFVDSTNEPVSFEQGSSSKEETWISHRFFFLHELLICQKISYMAIENYKIRYFRKGIHNNGIGQWYGHSRSSANPIIHARPGGDSLWSEGWVGLDMWNYNWMGNSGWKK